MVFAPIFRPPKIHPILKLNTIYDFLTGTIDQAAIDQRIAEIDEIDSRPNPGGFSKKGWEGEQNRLKGAAFEALGGLVLQTVRPFHAWNNVQTTTNEID